MIKEIELLVHEAPTTIGFGEGQMYTVLTRIERSCFRERDRLQMHLKNK